MTGTHRREPGGTERRDSDRRQAEKPFEGVDRRLDDRRSGDDRRTKPRG